MMVFCGNVAKGTTANGLVSFLRSVGIKAAAHGRDFLNEKGAKDPVQQRILGMKLARPEMYLEASYSRSLQMEGR